MSDRHQKLMDQAYARWQAQQGGWSKEQFWAQLSAAERFAVFTGNMTYQVQNGGWMQWYDNGYGTDETVSEILVYCQQMGTPAALAVRKILQDVCLIQKGMALGDEAGEDDEEDYRAYSNALDPLCDAFYQVDAQFLVECEQYLVATFVQEG